MSKKSNIIRMFCQKYDTNLLYCWNHYMIICRYLKCKQIEQFSTLNSKERKAHNAVTNCLILVCINREGRYPSWCVTRHSLCSLMGFNVSHFKLRRVSFKRLTHLANNSTAISHTFIMLYLNIHTLFVLKNKFTSTQIT